jgi:hypothetical protein
MSGLAFFTARFRILTMHALMKNPAFGGQPVFRPCLLNMNKTALPLAECKMLNGREHKKIGFGERRLHG